MRIRKKLTRKHIKKKFEFAYQFEKLAVCKLLSTSDMIHLGNVSAVHKVEQMYHPFD